MSQDRDKLSQDQLSRDQLAMRSTQFLMSKGTQVQLDIIFMASRKSLKLYCSFLRVDLVAIDLVRIDLMKGNQTSNSYGGACN